MKGVSRSRPGLYESGRKLSVLARRQFGVVSRNQLRWIGIDRSRLEAMVRAGRLISVHRGVYAIGGATMNLWSRSMAAVLAFEGEARVSHLTAAYLRKLLRVPEAGVPAIHVLVLRKPVRREGIVHHEVNGLDWRDFSDLNGIPVTSPARTLLDLAGMSRRECPDRLLAAAVTECLVREHATANEIDSVLARYPRRRGCVRLRALLADAGPDASVAETRLRRLFARAGLPTPEQNVTVRGHQVDFLWRKEKLVVEFDGYRFHSAMPSFVGDRRRDRRLTLADYVVLRFTWEDISVRPESVITEVRMALQRRRASA